MLECDSTPKLSMDEIQKDLLFFKLVAERKITVDDTTYEQFMSVPRIQVNTIVLHLKKN